MKEQTRQATERSEQYESPEVPSDSRPIPALDAILEAEERYRLLVSSMSDMVYAIDRNGTVTFISSQVTAYGFQQEEVLGRNFLEFIATEDRELVLRDFERSMADGKPTATHFRLVTRWGEARWIEDLGSPFNDTTGRIAGQMGMLRDITERKRVEEALRESETRYRALFENAPVGIYRTTPDGRILLGNPALVGMLGFSSFEELAARNLNKKGFSPAYPRKWFVEKVEEEGAVAGLEASWVKRDGSAIVLRENARTVRGEDGTVLYYDGTVEDVTERVHAKKTTEALYDISRAVHSAETLDQLFPQIHRALSKVIRAENFFIALLSDEGDKIRFPYAVDEMVPACTVVIDADDAQSLTAEVIRTRKPLLLLEKELQERYASGRSRIRLVASKCWLGVPLIVGKHVAGAMGVQDYLRGDAYSDRDLRLFESTAGQVATAIVRKRAEDALRDSEQRLRAVFETAKDLIFIKDASQRYVRVNPAMAEQFGTSVQAVIGRTAKEMMGPEDPEAAAQVEATDRRVLAGEVVEEVIEARSVGAPRTFYVIKVPIHNSDGAVTGLCGIARDISDLKRAESERLEMERRLQHTQKLESLGVMAGGIAHDFNNLLLAILGNLDLALLDLSEVSSARPSVEQAACAARRAADLTRQMLAYSGKGKFDVRAVNLTELVEENLHIFRAAISKSTALNLQLGRDLRPIIADPGQLQQVVMNLITNASEAIGERAGVISVVTEMSLQNASALNGSRLEEKPSPGLFVSLEVSDTGCGMSSDTMHRLFDPFFTTKFTGRGLGMSAVLGIVRGHKGAIFVESECGRGTTVRVLFPVSELEAVVEDRRSGFSKADAQNLSTRHGSGTILVVDDEEMLRNLGAALARRFGFDVLVASDGEEAVSVFRKRADDIVCVLLDLTMPRRDGLSAFEELRCLRPDVRVILSSGYSQQEATGQFAGKGLAGFIQKPYRMEDLYNELGRVLGCRRPEAKNDKERKSGPGDIQS
ncbi:MAG: PAS domain S-box protein [Candidatus Eisenbacteria bacterium]